jgi:hypothetical protein
MFLRKGWPSVFVSCFPLRSTSHNNVGGRVFKRFLSSGTVPGTLEAGCPTRVAYICSVWPEVPTLSVSSFLCYTHKCKGT